VMHNVSDSWNAGSFSAPIYQRTKDQLMKSLLVWFETQNYQVSKVEGIDQRHLVIKSRFITPVWGFIDQFYVLLTPLYNASNTTVITIEKETSFAVQVQSESRWAGGDFDQNRKRVEYFLNSFRALWTPYCYKPRISETILVALEISLPR